MNDQLNHPSPDTLKHFKPLDRLDDIQRELLASSLHIHSAGKGSTLIQEGDASHFSLYLLSGTLQLTSADGRVSEIDADVPQAANPIANLIPRRYTVEALTIVDYLMIDGKLLEELVSGDTQGITATELPTDSTPFDQTVTENNLSKALLEDLENDQLVLPSLPDVAVRVGRAMRDENTNARILANVVQTDPAITTKLIRAANSPLYAGVTPVDSCPAAIIRLGADTTHKLVLTFALRELFNTRSKVLKQHMQQLWEHSVKVSAVCYVLARVSDQFNPEHALLAGLLHDIGSVAILSYAERFPEVAGDGEKLEQVITDMRGKIGSAILRNWGFIEDLIVVAEEAENWLREHEREADYADLVIIAQLHTHIGHPEMAHLPTLDQVPALKKLKMGELTPKLSLKILDKAEEKITRAESLLRT
ncbi:MAG: HDOD domain-containing protein [Candidatus Thiodiazotropha sp. (ex Monitilora ramsayi)]|nr:HDOD domain-containing protein [Candidatus Thiodiazotropha sp. (ex Monitilora ramsayi)]